MSNLSPSTRMKETRRLCTKVALFLIVEPRRWYRKRLASREEALATKTRACVAIISACRFIRARNSAFCAFSVPEPSDFISRAFSINFFTPCYGIVFTTRDVKGHVEGFRRQYQLEKKIGNFWMKMKLLIVNFKFILNWKMWNRIFYETISYNRVATFPNRFGKKWIPSARFAATSTIRAKRFDSASCCSGMWLTSFVIRCRSLFWIDNAIGGICIFWGRSFCGLKCGENIFWVAIIAGTINRAIFSIRKQFWALFRVFLGFRSFLLQVFLIV